MPPKAVAGEDQEEDIEEKKKKDPNPNLPGDPSWTYDERVQVRNRIRDSGTPLGFCDYAFDASSMIQDSYDIALDKCASVQEMMDIVLQAARKMRDEDWERYQEIPFKNVHMDDQVVHGTCFAQKEPTWKAVLQKPKKTKSVCCFLHIGTEAPSSNFLDFMTKLGWLGVCIGPNAPPPGNEDLIQYTRINPADWKDQSRIDDLTSPSGGLVPKPAHFSLTYVNVTFNAQEDTQFLDPWDDDYDQKKEERRKKKEKEEKLAAGEADAGSRPMTRGSEKGSDFLSSRPTSSGYTVQSEEDMQYHEVNEEMMNSQSVFRDQNAPPRTVGAAGYGKIGMTRGERIRQRLRALRNSLCVAVNRLANEGSLIIFWPGLPLHPVLFFIVASLRRMFTRVHVISPEGSKTFDIYILGVGFKRDIAENEMPGIGGLELKSFFNNNFRTDTLDDILYWTLTPPEEEEEAGVGAAGRGLVASWTDLFKTWAEKFRALAMDLGIVILADGQQPPPPPRLPGKAEGKAKASPKKAPVKKKGSDSGSPEGSKEPAEEGADSKPKEAEAAPAEKEEAPKEVKEASKVPKEKDKEKDKEKEKEKEKEKDKEKEKEKEKEKAEKTRDGSKTKNAETKTDSAKASRLGSKTRKDSKEKVPAEAPKEEEQEKEKEAETSFEDKMMRAEEFLDTPKKKRFKLSRSLPYLSSSLGAAPGHRLKQPSYEELATQFKLFDTAKSVAEHGRMMRWDVSERRPSIQGDQTTLPAVQVDTKAQTDSFARQLSIGADSKKSKSSKAKKQPKIKPSMFGGLDSPLRASHSGSVFRSNEQMRSTT